MTPRTWKTCAHSLPSFYIYIYLIIKLTNNLFSERTCTIVHIVWLWYKHSTQISISNVHSVSVLLIISFYVLTSLSSYSIVRCIVHFVVGKTRFWIGWSDSCLHWYRLIACISFGRIFLYFPVEKPTIFVRVMHFNIFEWTIFCFRKYKECNADPEMWFHNQQFSSFRWLLFWVNSNLPDKAHCTIESYGSGQRETHFQIKISFIRHKCYEIIDSSSHATCNTTCSENKINKK